MLGQILNLLSQPLSSLRGRLVVGWLIITGAASITIGQFAGGAGWVLPTQILLAAAFIVGALLIYTPAEGRNRVIAGAVPAFGAVILGIVFLPQYLLILSGAGLGWFVAALFLFRQQTPRDVVVAIRQMRKGNYKDAVVAIDEMIKRDRNNPEHYRLRAMIFRLDGRLDRSLRDYEMMLKLADRGEAGDAIRAEAYDGLSEVHLQAGRYEKAHEAAMSAHNLYPDNWVPLYNLGLINDRLRQSEQVVEHLTTAFDRKIPDARQRLLAHLYLARAHNRLGDSEAAQSQVSQMENLWKGLEGLEKLMNDEQSAPLSAVLAEDVKTARALMIDELDANEL
jgi:tetratricopeptide (TPR) repeat protein